MVRLLTSWRFYAVGAAAAAAGAVIGVLAGTWFLAIMCACCGIAAALEARRLHAVR